MATVFFRPLTPAGSDRTELVLLMHLFKLCQSKQYSNAYRTMQQDEKAQSAMLSSDIIIRTILDAMR